jgi:uncharacterized integral membrane protein
MRKLLLILVAGALVLLFALNNTHHVEMSLIFGTPVHVRLVFLLLTTFLIGHFSAVVLNLYLRTKTNSGANRAERRETSSDSEEDEFFLQ